ncbi:hypothetical protein JCM11641_005309 [Rhodosporidiobolus odoratus]
MFLSRNIVYDDLSGKVVVRFDNHVKKALKLHNFEDIKPMHPPISPTSLTRATYLAMKKEEGLAGFVNSDFAGDPPSRKSTSGIILTLRGSPLSTISRLQSSITRTTFQAELLAVLPGLVDFE